MESETRAKVQVLQSATQDLLERARRLVETVSPDGKSSVRSGEGGGSPAPVVSPIGFGLEEEGEEGGKGVTPPPPAAAPSPLQQDGKPPPSTAVEEEDLPDILNAFDQWATTATPTPQPIESSLGLLNRFNELEEIFSTSPSASPDLPMERSLPPSTTPPKSPTPAPSTPTRSISASRDELVEQLRKQKIEWEQLEREHEQHQAERETILAQAKPEPELEQPIRRKALSLDELLAQRMQQTKKAAHRSPPPRRTSATPDENPSPPKPHVSPQTPKSRRAPRTPPSERSRSTSHSTQHSAHKQLAPNDPLKRDGWNANSRLVKSDLPNPPKLKKRYDTVSPKIDSRSPLGNMNANHVEYSHGRDRGSYLKLKAAAGYQQQHKQRSHSHKVGSRSPSANSACSTPPPKPKYNMGPADDTTALLVPDSQTVEQKQRLQAKFKKESAALSKEMIACADQLHHGRLTLRKLQAEVDRGTQEMEAVDASFDVESQSAALKLQKEELQKQYKQSLLLAAKRRQASKVRRSQGKGKRKEDIERELNHLKANMKKIEKVVESVTAKRNDLQVQVEEFSEQHHEHQLVSCKEKLRWLKDNFPTEYELAMLSHDGTAAEELFTNMKKSLAERKEYLLSVLRDLRHGQELEPVIAGKADQLNSLRNEARLQSTELRCRQAAEINWRSILQSSPTLTTQQLLQHCSAIRNQVLPVSLDNRDEEDVIKRRMEALGTAELVETWLSTIDHSAGTGVAIELGAFLEALAAESEGMEAELQEKLQAIEEQTATLGKLVAMKGSAELRSVEQELQDTVDEIIRVEGAEQERVVRYNKKKVRLVEAAGRKEVPVMNSLDDWRAVLCVGRPEERSGFIQCIMRAEAIIIERMTMWAQAGDIDMSDKDMKRALDDTETLLKENEEKLFSCAKRAAELERQCVALHDVGEEEEEGNNPLKLQRQMLENLEDEILRAEQCVRDSAEKKIRNRHTKQREMLMRLTAKKGEVTQLVKEEKELEQKMTSLRKNYEAKLQKVAHEEPSAPPPPPRRQQQQPKYTANPCIKTPPRPTSANTTTPTRTPPMQAKPVYSPDSGSDEFLQREIEAEVTGGQEVQLFGPSSPMVPAEEAIRELKRINKLVQNGSTVWKKVKGGYGKRRLRLAADLSRTEIRKEGKKIAEDFIRSDHMVKVIRAKPDQAAGTYPFTVQLRDARLEFFTETPEDTSDWVTVLSLLIRHRSSLFFLKYNLRHLLR